MTEVGPDNRHGLIGDRAASQLMELHSHCIPARLHPRAPALRGHQFSATTRPSPRLREHRQYTLRQDRLQCTAGRYTATGRGSTKVESGRPRELGGADLRRFSGAGVSSKYKRRLAESSGARTRTQMRPAMRTGPWTLTIYQAHENGSVDSLRRMRALLRDPRSSSLSIVLPRAIPHHEEMHPYSEVASPLSYSFQNIARL
jgi:hypothetical protein